MSIDVESGDWPSIDTWWESCAESTSITVRPDSIQFVGADHLQDHWIELDEWSAALATTSPVVNNDISKKGLNRTQLSENWKDIDPWWNEYVTTGHDTAEHLAAVLAESNTAWKTGNALFSSDPLAADVTGTSAKRGPLRPTNEVAWSRWLSRLLKPSEALVTELFGVSVEEAPQEVIREDRLKKEDGSYRRPDILVRHSDQSISIEVKIDDKNYSKTAETAQLVEQQYDEEWAHTLLLPKRHASRLDAIVEPGLTNRSDGNPLIEWDEPGAIKVLYWRDVTAALRTLLQRGDVVDDHWAANAYLFCAVAEQQLLGFCTQNEICQMAEPGNVVDTIQPITLADTLEEQLTYLREMTKT